MALCQLRAGCRDLDVMIAGGGAQPFSRYRNRLPILVTAQLLSDGAGITRRLAIFGPQSTSVRAAAITR